jgi:hypothetical protein
VEKVRTGDDAQIVVKLMIFFELKDINTMLDRTHDPIADFTNSATADIIDFVGSHTFENFKLNIDKLNNLEIYKNLVERAAGIGFEVHKVVFRGYSASPTLQEMHNHAIEKRTQLILEEETEKQAQNLSDFTLTRELERNRQKKDMEENETMRRLKLERLQSEEKLRQHTQQEKTQLEHTKKENELNLKFNEETFKQKLHYLNQLKDLGVDVTKVLVAQEQGSPNKWIKVESSDSLHKVPNIHVHD